MLDAMKPLALALTIALFVIPAAAMKSHHETFPQSCDVLWKASVAVAKSQEYRIVGISKEEWILSLSTGGAWWGERLISLSLEAAGEHGCTATVQSRYSGVEHSDGPDLLGRIHVQLVGDELGRDSDAFLKFKTCVENSYSHETKCEEKFRKRAAAQTSKAQGDNAVDPSKNWNITKP